MSSHDRATSRTRRVLSGVRSFGATALTGALAIGLVIAGSSMIAERADSVELPQAAPSVAVDILRLTREPGYSVTRSFVGQIEAAQQTDLSFETGGTLQAVLVDEGDLVEAGQVVARIDTRLLEAERTALEAVREGLLARLELAELTTDRQAALEQKGFAATQRYDEARLTAAELRARIRETDAGLTRIDVALDKAVLRAPFAGRVGARQADLGQTVGAGTPVLSLLEDVTPRMRVGLPSDMAAELSVGDRVRASFGAQTYEAVLTQLRPDLDPLTRTRSAIFALSTAEGQALPPYGQSGHIHLPQSVDDPGAWVPLLTLREGPNGSWTVLTVDGESRVASEAVEILHSDETRAFVRGSFADGAALVASGPHRLAPGQPVRIAE